MDTKELFQDVLECGFEDGPEPGLFEEAPQEAAVPASEEAPAPVSSDYAAKKKAERDAVYSLADETVRAVSSDLEKAALYLEVQSKFPATTATNALLIMAQEPDATVLHTFDEWSAVGGKIKKGAAAIAVIKPGGEFRKRDGSVGTSFIVSKVFSDMQVNAAQPNPSKNKEHFAAVDFINGVVRSMPVQFVKVDTVSGYARYNARAKVIEYQSRMPSEEVMFQRAVYAWARAEYDIAAKDYVEADSQFCSAALAYMLCRHYGFRPVPIVSLAPLQGLSPLDQRRKLENIRRQYQVMVDKVDRQLARIAKQRGGDAR